MATYSRCLANFRPGHLLVACGCLWTSLAPAHGQEYAAGLLADDVIDQVMFHDPTLELSEPQLKLPDGLKELWLRAMARSEVQLQRLAADSFVLAHQRGLRDLEDAYEPLAELLRAPDQDAAVKRAAAHALIELEARDYAPLLAETAGRGGLHLALLVEPALARWKSDVMREAWLARIEDPRSARAARMLAIEALGEVRERKAAERLRVLVADPGLDPAERLAAARSVSQLEFPNVVDLAKQMAEDSSQPAVLHSTLAVALLQHEDGAAAIELLRRLATDSNTAVQGGAMRRLFEIDPKHVYDLAEKAIGSPDSVVRSIGAEALILQRKFELIAPLATLLDDVNPTLRRRVAMALVQLADEPALHDEVIVRASEMLAGDQWRGLEQAGVVLVLLEHKPAGSRLVELLSFPRGEVMHVAGWGLRRLAIPEHLPAMLQHAQSVYDGFQQGTTTFESAGAEFKIAQLFMAFGHGHFADAEPLLRKYVPKDHSLGAYARAAAVWAVGFLNENKAPQDLTKELLARLADTMSFEPEAPVVRQMSAISIGRMNSQFATNRLRQLAVVDAGYPKRATYWAIEQLTGEASPPPDPRPFNFGDWFLRPAN